MSLERRQIRFAGRVQGVGFRATTRGVAAGHPVSGWVRNEADGSVLVEAQGKPDAIDAFLQDLRTRMSRYISWESPNPAAVIENEQGFAIRH
jgi:acylphosphatase